MKSMAILMETNKEQFWTYKDDGSPGSLALNASLTLQYAC